MRLKQGEHSILASFPSRISARAAVRALREAGIEEVQLDHISFGDGEQGGESLAAHAGSLTGQMLSTAGGNQLADGGVTTSGAGFLVTVVTGGTKLNQALKIIARHGGIV